MTSKFILPDFVRGEAAYNYLTDLQQDHPEVFIDFTEMTTVYGIFGSCIWNGGTIMHMPQFTREEMDRLIQHYNYDLGLKLRFTFTNVFVDDDMCHDTYANIICKAGHNGMNEISIANPVLERYLRDKYPDYKFVRSVIAAEDRPYCLYGSLGPYSSSVLKRIHNNDWDFLDSVNDLDRGKIELLCNDPCPDNCPRLYTHYRDFARAQIEYKTIDDSLECSMWNVKGDFPYHYASTQLKTYIDRENIDNNYVSRGYQYFKLSGRNEVKAIIMNILTYLIKPEYRPDVAMVLMDIYGIN